MNDAMLAPRTTPSESWTEREILQQPETLLATHALLSGQAQRIADFLAPLLARKDMRIILTGAGTSAFIGDSIAPLLSRQLNRCVEAIATTDIVSAPDLYLRREEPTLLLSFGRSGNSPESIAAVDLADRFVREVHHLIITCNADGSLAKRDHDDGYLLVLPEATHDRAFAMTSSFSAMMLAALTIFADPLDMAARVPPLAAAVRAMIEQSRNRVADLAGRDFQRVVYLGSGPFKGLAREAALKLLELSDGRIVTAFDSSLGFRHGPKTIVDATTLVVVFLSNDPLTRRYDADIVAELRADARCGALLTISAQSGDGADIVAPGMAAAADADLLFPFIVPAQLLALDISLHMGLTPDTPNLSGTVNRVVQGVSIHTPA